MKCDTSPSNLSENDMLILAGMNVDENRAQGKSGAKGRTDKDKEAKHGDTVSPVQPK